MYNPKLILLFKSCLKFSIFMSLLIVCYIFFMKDAIEKSKKGATTVTARQVKQEYESPDIILCPNPAFKPSISTKYEFQYPTRDLFNMHTNFTEQYKSIFENKTVWEVFEEFSYANDLEFKSFQVQLKEGANPYEYGNTEWLKIRTTYDGVCHIIQERNNKSEQSSAFTIHYKEKLEVVDHPKSFFIYFTPKDQWQGECIFIDEQIVI